MTCLCFPDDARTNAVRSAASIGGRIAALVRELEDWPADDVGSERWLDSLEAAATARRELDELELLVED